MAVEPPYRTKNFVKGMIILWYGSVAAIPSGWHLCDGSLDTPDLRNRFIVGAGDAYDAGDNAGAPTHLHNFTGDGHTHTLTSGFEILPGANVNQTLQQSPAAGTTDPNSALVPYKALCYIMKWN